VYYTLVHCERVSFKVTGINFMTVYRAKKCGLLLARVTTILPRYLPGNRTFYAPFGMHQLSLRRGEAGFGLLADTRVSRLKGKRDDIKRCILLIQFLTVPDTNNLIANITE